MNIVDPEGDNFAPLSALNAMLYCDRRAALRHLDCLYVHNEHTRRGDSLHRRADRAGFERRKGVRTERGLWVASRRLRLYGRADLVEFRAEPGRRIANLPRAEVPLPVEYKRGKARAWDNDEVQLCAQGLCLEEMLGRSIHEGAIFHAASKKRRAVPFSAELRAVTEAAVEQLHSLLQTGVIPPVVVKRQCRGCSLRGHCLPEVFSHPIRIAAIRRGLFTAGLSDPKP